MEVGGSDMMGDELEMVGSWIHWCHSAWFIAVRNYTDYSQQAKHKPLSQLSYLRTTVVRMKSNQMETALVTLANDPKRDLEGMMCIRAYPFQLNRCFRYHETVFFGSAYPICKGQKQSTNGSGPSLKRELRKVVLVDFCSILSSIFLNNIMGEVIRKWGATLASICWWCSVLSHQFPRKQLNSYTGV